MYFLIIKKIVINIQINNYVKIHIIIIILFNAIGITTLICVNKILIVLNIHNKNAIKFLLVFIMVINVSNSNVHFSFKKNYVHMF